MFVEVLFEFVEIQVKERAFFLQFQLWEARVRKEGDREKRIRHDKMDVCGSFEFVEIQVKERTHF